MITAVDTNVLLDVLTPDPVFELRSVAALDSSHLDGPVLISEPVYAELAVRFPERETLDFFLSSSGIQLQASNQAALHRAGQAWRDYLARRPIGFLCRECGLAQNPVCQRCGASLARRQHVLADFLIGAHAVTHADRLLTRDRGYYATYFPELRLA